MPILLCSNLLYWMVGLNLQFYRSIIYLVAMTFLTIFGVSSSLAIGAISRNHAESHRFSGGLLLLLVIYDGDFGNFDSIPAYLR